MAIAGIVIGAVMTVLSVLSIWLVFWAVNEVSDHPEWINVNGTVCKNGKCTVCHNGDCQVCDEDECDIAVTGRRSNQLSYAAVAS